jgi:hypothetical protein
MTVTVSLLTVSQSQVVFCEKPILTVSGLEKLCITVGVPRPKKCRRVLQQIVFFGLQQLLSAKSDHRWLQQCKKKEKGKIENST